MNISQSFLLAIKSLKQSKLRTFLTMLGIIVGVASVFAIITLSDSMKYTLINMGNSAEKIINLYRIDYSEELKVREIVKNNPKYVKTFAQKSTIKAVVRSGYKTLDSVPIVGESDEAYKQEIELIDGDFLNYVDLKDGNKKCIIEEEYAKYFFGKESPIGKSIFINEIEFKIVGVVKLKAKETMQALNDIDFLKEMTNIYVPLSSFNIITDFDTSNAETYLVLQDDVDTKVAIGKLNREFKKYNLNIRIDTNVEDNGESTLDAVKYILAAIAALSLFVGGIGIMNIMLVTVTERIREIGIRKSLGANPKDILTQFLIEATTVSLIGGIIGIIFGIIISFLILNVISSLLGMELKMTVTIISIVLSSVSSIIIGIIFGYFPARKAAKMDPIDALSYE